MFYFLTMLVVSLLCSAFATVAGRAEATDGVVTISCGRRLRGAKGPDHELYAFRGIRYAKPPVGDRRWMPTQGLGDDSDCSDTESTEIEDASMCGPVCPQVNMAFGVPALEIAIISLVVGLVLLLVLLIRCRRIGASVSSQVGVVEPLMADAETENSGLSASSPKHGTKKRMCCSICLLVAGLILIGLAYPFFWMSWQLSPSFPVVGSEDCLFLNVYTRLSESSISNHDNDPQNNPQLRPVLVFLPGGSSVMGTGCDYGLAAGDNRVDISGNPVPCSVSASYGAPWPAVRGEAETGDDGFVVVQLNYRLGVFGFFHLNERSPGGLDASNSKKGIFPSANVAFLDVMEALRWVQMNIRGFGGDPDQVTLYGQSTGGTLLLGILALADEKLWTMPDAESHREKPLFHRIWSTSASPRIDATKDDADVSWRNLLLSKDPKSQGGNLCPHYDPSTGSDAELRRCLMSKSTQELLMPQVNDPVHRMDQSWIFDLPFTPIGQTNGNDADLTFFPLIIADGAIVAGNVSNVLSLAKASGQRFPVVPTLIGANSAEPDLAATDPKPFSPFSRKPFTDWANRLWGPTFGAAGSDSGNKLWRLYENVSVKSRMAYDQLTSDVRFICGNVYSSCALGRRLHDSPVYDPQATPPDRSNSIQRPQVYNYVFNINPRGSLSFLGFSIGKIFKYPCHMWDTNLFYGATFLDAMLSSRDKPGSLSYKFADEDRQVASRFRKDILEFARTGRIARWDLRNGNQYASQSAWMPCVYTEGLELGGVCDKNEFEVYRLRCGLFEKFGTLIRYSDTN